MKLHPKYILIMSLNIIFLFSFIFSNYLIKIYSNKVIFVFIIVFVLSLLVLLLLPKSFPHILKNIYNSTFIRYILIAYIIISSLLLGYVLFNIISIRFFFVTPTFLIMIMFSYFIVIGQIFNLKSIINTTFFISVILLFLILIPFISSSGRDFNLLHRLDYKFSSNLSFLLIGLVPLDNLLFLLIPKRKDIINKYDLLISCLIGLTISGFFIIDNFTFIDYSFFKDMNFGSLYRYKLYYGPKYIEHFDNFLNIILCCYLYLKCLINGKLLKSLLLIKNNIISSIGFSVVFLLCNIYLYYSFIFKIDYVLIPLILLSILLLIIYIFLIRRTLHERKYQ